MRKYFLFIILGSAAVLACTKDKYESPAASSEFCDSLNVSYDSHVRAIVEASCAVSGCHESGAGIGDFTSYLSLEPYLTNGRFETRVITQQDMPPSWSTVSALTQEELDQISCWINSNTPEN